MYIHTHARTFRHAYMNYIYIYTNRCMLCIDLFVQLISGFIKWIKYDSELLISQLLKTNQSQVRDSDKDDEWRYVCVWMYVYVSTLQHSLRMRTGWRRCIARLKLQVCFCKRATNCRVLLRKITCKEKVFYGCSPLCIERWCHVRDVSH